MTEYPTQPEPAADQAPQRPPREEQAWREIGVTEMPRWLAVTLTVTFVLLLVAVPVSQHIYELKQDEGELQAYDIFEIGRDVQTKWEEKEGNLLKKLLAANSEALRQINRYESDLEDASWMTHSFLGPVTLFQARHLGAGNEEAYVGRDGWLFFRQDFDHVTGAPFLDPDRLEARASAGNEYTAPPQPDPRKAILQFRDQLAERGIQLIVMPTPVKPTVHPEMFSRAYADHAEPVQNASYNQFIGELKAQGIHIYDPAPDLRAWALESAEPVYLKTDTHWNASVSSVANRLANRIRALIPSEIAPVPHHESVADHSRASFKLPPRTKVSHLGDIAQMLDLPEGQTLFEPESVEVFQVTGQDGQPWRPTRSAPVLLLGDSFTNIYSMEALGWGTHGGLGALLSWQLDKPVDVIAINAGGAHAARQALVADLARGNDRLSGTKVVVWQFATRELSFGDWKLLDLPGVQAKQDPTPKRSDGQVIATATVVDRTHPPKPGSVPYRDAVIAIKVQDLQAQADGVNLPAEAVLYAWGMRDNKLVDAAWVKGKNVRLMLQPWEQAEAEYGNFNRFELDDPEALFMDAYWAEVIE